MQRKYLLRAALILLLIAGSYLVLWSATNRPAKTENCTESMEECCQKDQENSSPAESLIGNFTRQFISIPVLDY